MLAAALTIWVMFSTWLIAECAGLPRAVARVAMILLALELTALAVWSYGSESCDERTCAPLAQAAGIAARTDVPILAGGFVVVTLVQLTRYGRARPPV
jgi:4-amino-4-deoxy-L-arabinose transferase-like glycosyltransferase